MILEKIGVGIDIVHINKFRKLNYKSNKNFYEKIFSDSEIEYCLKFSEPAQHFSGKFAIKEAVVKSIKNPLPLIDIITDHFDSKPIVHINNNDDYFFKISLSHDEDYAIAIVLSEKLL